MVIDNAYFCQCGVATEVEVVVDDRVGVGICAVQQLDSRNIDVPSFAGQNREEPGLSSSSPAPVFQAT